MIRGSLSTFWVLKTHSSGGKSVVYPVFAYVWRMFVFFKASACVHMQTMWLKKKKTQTKHVENHEVPLWNSKTYGFSSVVFHFSMNQPDPTSDGPGCSLPSSVVCWAWAFGFCGAWYLRASWACASYGIRALDQKPGHFGGETLLVPQFPQGKKGLHLFGFSLFL